MNSVGQSFLFRVMNPELRAKLLINSFENSWPMANFSVAICCSIKDFLSI